jgi:hypothetical protein
LAALTALQDLYGSACDCIAFAMWIAIEGSYKSSTARGARRVRHAFTGNLWARPADRTTIRRACDEQPFAVRPGSLQAQGEGGREPGSASR